MLEKVLCINVSDQGSTGKIIEDIAKNSRDYEFVLCVPYATRKSKLMKIYSLMRIPHEQGIYRRIAKIIGYPFGFAPLSTIRLEQIIKYEKPDLVHIHCINMNMVNIYKLFAFLSESKIPVVVTNHAEFYYTGSCAHAEECMQWKKGCETCENFRVVTESLCDKTKQAWKKMKKSFENIENITVISVSPWVEKRCRMSCIMKSIKQEMILNGVNTNVFTPRETTEVCSKLKLNGRKLILHVTASFSKNLGDLKGGYFFLKLAEKYCDNEGILFVVAGHVGNDIEEYELPNNILILGNIADQDQLAKLYSAATMTIVTSKRETFSMPVAESLCCGTPVIGFEAGGPESIALKEFSEFVPYGDENALKNAFEKWISVKSVDIEKQCAALAKDKYDSKIMTCKYEEVYQKMLRR